MNTPEQTKNEFFYGFALGADIDRSLARPVWRLLSASVPESERARDIAQGRDRGFELGQVARTFLVKKS